MSFDRCLFLHQLSDKLPVHDMREEARHYADTEGIPITEALERVVSEHLDQARAGEAHILSTVSEQYAARGGKIKTDKAAMEKQQDGMPAPESDARIAPDDAPPTVAGEHFDRATNEHDELPRSIDTEPATPTHGADAIRASIQEAKARGDISPELADITDWFIRQNPAIADELGMSIRSHDSQGNSPAGSYRPVDRLMTLFKGAANDTTGVHEILHHMERLMPRDMQDAIRSEYAKRTMALSADTRVPMSIRNFLRAALDAHNGNTEAATTVNELSAKVPDGYYQYINPSEFWAVNAARLMGRRFAAREGVWARIADWTRNAVQHIKGVLGMESDAPVLRALDKVMGGESGMIPRGARMLSDAESFNADRRSIEVDGIRRPAYDSNDNPVAYNFQDQLAFWRWYGSGSVDEHGRPIAVNGEYINGDGETRPVAGDTYLDRTKSTQPQQEVDDADQSRMSKLIGVPKEMLRSAASSVRQLVMPIADGSMQAMAWAKDFASRNRKAEAQWQRADKVLEKNYTKDQLEKMWIAADEENDLRREGKTAPDKGLNSLPADQRETVELLNKYGQALWDKARAAGMVEGDGVAYWTPRVAARIHEDGTVENLRGSGPGEPSKDARNLRTSASSMKGRKYETLAESEAALKSKFGDDAGYVKNIRVMPRAMAELEKAISGRTLVNQIKAHGQVLGEELFSDNGDKNFVLIDHPALKRWQPKIDWLPADMGKIAAKGLEVRKDGVYKDGEQLASYRIRDGEVQQRRALEDENGKPVMTSSPLYVRKDFAGPLKAVFSKEPNAVYRGLMEVKSLSMNMIMLSPATHNMVIWGKAMPSMVTAMGWKNNAKNLLTGGVYSYVVGHHALADHALMNGLIERGLVPMGGRGMNPDLPAIADGIAPGRSLVAKVLGSVADLAHPKAGEAVRKGIDAAGHFWHETLLWDRVGDLQVGMAVQLRNHIMDHGVDEDTATRIATFFANRYAGAIPQEAISSAAHAVMNVTLFSKSFTLTNAGAMKDPFVGLPKEVQAQIKMRTFEAQKALGKTDIEATDAAGKVLKQAQSVTRKKATAILMVDFAAMAAVSSLAQAWLAGQSGQQFVDDLKERMHALGVKLDADNPLSFLGPQLGKVGLPMAFLRHPFDNLASLSQTSENPHGKEDRVRLGDDEQGNAYYMRLPVGKVVEEMKHYLHLDSAVDLLKNKLSPLVKSGTEVAQNQDFQGRRIYTPEDSGLTQIAKSVGHILKAQVPFDDMVALKHVMAGDHDQGGKAHIPGIGDLNMDEAKLLGTATGLTVSKEAGGDAVAELRHQNREQQAKLHDVLPDVREAVRRGDTDSAYDMLEQAGQTPHEIRNTIKMIDQPDHMSKQALRKFNQHADDDARERMDRFRK